MEEMQNNMLDFMLALKELNTSKDIKDLIETDVSDLDDKIENERLMKNLILAMRDFIPAANRVSLAYIEVYQQAMKEGL